MFIQRKFGMIKELQPQIDKNTHKTSNIVVIIPCYEPSEKQFVPYIERLLETNIRAVVVVNDGNGEKYIHIFDMIKELDKEKIHCIGYSENRGKGYALKTAFSYCTEHFTDEDVFVTADCDGQHTIEDVLRVGRCALRNKKSFILGGRDFTLPCVPMRSRQGNQKTSAVVRFLYGINVKDTQTGLRGFSYALLPMLTEISGDRFEYETNQLICLSRKQISIKEIPIETIYEEKAEDVEKVSHFKTVRDSARVMKVLFRNLGWYFFSSVISALLDVAVFTVLFAFILQIPSLTLKTLVATVTARILSSIVNFTFNYKLVFGGKGAKSILRYYILWFFQLGASFGLARLWAGITSIKAIVSILKALSDILLAVLSYQVQRTWVFANEMPPKHFYGATANFTKLMFKLFSGKYDAKNITYPEEGRVYVCRHLNMHGCYTVVKSLDFNVHILAYNVFFTFKDAFKQYSEITFASNGKATLRSKIKAFFPALFVPLLIHSAKAIPVYRKSARSYTTIRKATDALLKNECVLLFPDVDYKAPQEQESEIYKGFLLLERNYYKETHKHLKFVPLYISDEEKKIYEHSPIMFEDGDFKSQLDTVANQIRNSIQNNVDTF